MEHVLYKHKKKKIPFEYYRPIDAKLVQLYLIGLNYI